MKFQDIIRENCVFSLIQQFIHHKMEVDGIVCLRLVIV